MNAVAWLDYLSTEWPTKHLKYATTLQTRRVDASSDHRGYVGLENIESWTGRLITADHGNKTNGDEAETQGTATSFEVGDILFGKLRPYLAKAMLAENDGICSTELLVLKPGRELNPRFLFYVLLCPQFIALVDSSTFGAKMPRASWDFIGAIQVPLPSLPIQRCIAKYLDTETSQIDVLVAEKERMLALLEEKRTALVSRMVIRGLNPDVRMKPSGLDWLGDIPAHWKVQRCATLFTEVDERNKPDLPLLNVSINTGVTLRTFSDDRIESVAEDFTTYKVARKGQLVFNKMRFWQGAAGIAPVDGLASPDYTVAHISQALVPAFVELLFRLPQFSNEVRRYSYGMVDDRLRLYWDEFKNIRIPLPPINEQNAIVTALTQACSHTAELEVSLHRSIALLKERRSALITASVTGQLALEA